MTQEPSSHDSQRLPLQKGSARSSSAGTSLRRKRERMPGLAVLPTMLTLANAVAGVAALIELTKAYAALAAGDYAEVPTRLGFASLLIGAGMLFDALDGKVARMTATTGRFGAELDSLCDVVTFGVVPALMIRVGGEFFFARVPFALGFDTKLLWAVSGLYACCAILRLARYNVETDADADHNSFRGLPTPAAAASVCGVMLGCSWFYLNFGWFDEQPWPWVLRVVIPLSCAFIGLMMVTRLRYIHLFNRFVTRHQSFRTMILLLIVVALVVVLYEQWMLLVPAIMLTYVFSGPVYLAWRFLRGRGLLGRRRAVEERRRRRMEQKGNGNGAKDTEAGAA